MKTGNIFQVLSEFSEGLMLYRVWWTFAWQDIKLRYRRSIIGPFWITISMAVMVFSLGLLYGTLFKQDLSRFIPFLTIGFILWGLISGLLLDGCQTFIEHSGYILQTRLVLTVYACKVVAKNIILFLHNAMIYIIVAFIFKVIPSYDVWTILIGLFLISVNGIWAGLVLGILCSRFRDLPQIIASIVQISFFLTPILWEPSLVQDRVFIVNYNPFFHMIELVRAPLLGRETALISWMIVLGLTLFGFILSVLLYLRFSKRIPYWI